MQVISETTADRQVTVSATIDELAELYESLMAKRKTKAQKEQLALLADLLRTADDDLHKIIVAIEEEASADEA